MSKLTIKQEVNNALYILRDCMKQNETENGDIFISKDNLVLLAKAIKDLIDLTDTLDLCDFCSKPCINLSYERQICCENYYDKWTP